MDGWEILFCSHQHTTMMTVSARKSVLLFLLLPAAVLSFVIPHAPRIHPTSTTFQLQAEQKYVSIDAALDDEKVTALFAWVSRAFAGDPAYNNLMYAIAAIFGDLAEDSIPVQMAAKALKKLPPEELPVGDPINIYDREQASLGAMGASAWGGQWKTRPHALLQLTNQNIRFTTVDDWVQSLPRGCRRTIAKALAQNFTVTAKPIIGDEPAPHSSLAHFRCVVAHEVRLLSWGTEGFLDALSEAVSRYVGTTRMAGEIREYRNPEGKIIAIAHEIRKGRTVRGQWFYADDEAAKNYVWFHSVYDLVQRAIDAEGVDVVDLGPSGSDAFSELKGKYGFKSVDDWTAVADYRGEFWYQTTKGQSEPRKGSRWGY
jgi:hypothetical protein